MSLQIDYKRLQGLEDVKYTMLKNQKRQSFLIYNVFILFYNISRMKKVLWALVAIIAVLLVVAAFMPKEYKITTEVTVNRSPDVVWNYVKLIKNQPEYSVWSQMDPNAVITYSGVDGTVWFTQTWDGNKKVGKGEQTITAIDESAKSIDVDVYFIEPMEGMSYSRTTVEVFSTGGSLVVNHFGWVDKRPMNLLSLCYRPILQKMMQENLDNLKMKLESMTGDDIVAPGNVTWDVVLWAVTGGVVSWVGTEPFWSFILSGSELAWTAPDPISGDIVTTMYTGIDQVSTSGSSTIYANLSGNISLLVTPGSCSDGMSDLVYPGSVVVTLLTDTFNGCVK